MPEKSLKNSALFKLLIPALLTGIFASLTACAYRGILALAEQNRTTLLSLIDSPLKIILLFAALLLLALLTGRLIASEPLIKGSGIPQVEGQLLGFFSPRWPAVLAKKFVGGTLCIFAGLSLGREGPSIQLGAMAAQGYAELSHTEAGERKYLLICGACAGLAAAFNAPLAGIMFALEEIYKTLSPKAVFSAMVAALSAATVSELFFGTQATFDMLPIVDVPVKYYALYIATGLICGVLGAFYNKSLALAQSFYKLLPCSDKYKLILPFMLAGIAALTLPGILGGGHKLIELLGKGELLLPALLLLLAAKFIFSMFSFGSGAPGGIFFPLLVLGALVGSIIGRLAIDIFGIAESTLLNFMLLGMAGMFSSIVRAPLTGIVLIAEMSASFTNFIGLALVSCIACLTAALLKSRPVYEQLLDNITPGKLASAGSNEEINIITLQVPTASLMDTVRIKELPLPAHCHIVGIKRADKSLIPDGDTVILSGDILSIALISGSEHSVRSALGCEGLVG